MLIVEDGTLPEGANSYVSLEAADDTLIPRGLWPVTPPKDSEEPDEAEALTRSKISALLRATDWLNILPGGLWKGHPVHWDRRMAWPRRNVVLPGGGEVPADYVPEAVRMACLELAARIFNGKDVLAPQQRGGQVISERTERAEGVAGLTESVVHAVTYAPFAASESTDTVYPAVAALLDAFVAYMPGTPGTGAGGRCVEVGRG